MRAILFTELGIEPIRYRRLGLALGYLQSLLIQPDHRVVRDAFTHSLHLARSGHATWVNDLRSTLSKLPIPVHCTVDELTDADNLARLRKDIRQSCEQSLTSDIQASVRVHLLHNRLEFREDGQQLHTSPIITLRAYLDVIKVPKHRHTFTRLITSSHALSIERLRYEERYRSPIPREWRLCRFCRGAVEDECHALMVCEAQLTLVCLREQYWMEMDRTAPDIVLMQHQLSSYALLQRVLFDRHVLTLTAKYVYDVLAVFAGREPYIPESHLYTDA
ncbi:hypothetical protein C8R41DRAFT_773029 [Lentinula lateritia]|uniref:Reverse transcriptase zinc-binding domain-containing protein n=1 Tax=Lentinula lateritia TaxID=40482 RepID=A0ABQ8V6Y0_9AGAR|nr:hypothetical protein C8R41DRAFT_773029 [Lentinula lateritia]